MALEGINIIVHNSNGISNMDVSSAASTFQDVLNVLKTGQPSTGVILYSGNIYGTGQEIGLSLTEGGTPLTLSNLVTSVFPDESTGTIYALYPEPQAETITGFYLDGTKYEFDGGGTSYTAGNGIDITNDEIGLDGTYEGTFTDYSAIQGPAPSGFHVPLRTEWVALCGILTSTFGLANNNTTIETYLKMPRAGFRGDNNAGVNNVGAVGIYLSSTPYNTSKAYGLDFYASKIYPEFNVRKGHGSSVRCFKNFPTVPTSSWTTLYDGSGVATGAGVFYSATDGLISVSGDGVNWYTIQDKNLGATTVYNMGDTLSDANCGYFYQWGNNYGFAHSGTLTTSSTTVDASNYGPGNYYSSSTFITKSPRDSTSNNNLWGGATGIVQKTASGNLIIGDQLYKIVTSTTAPASGTASNIITIVTD